MTINGLKESGKNWHRQVGHCRAIAGLKTGDEREKSEAFQAVKLL